MPWTRLQYQTAVRDAADATSASRWSATEVSNALDLSFAAEWKRLLNVNRFLRMSRRDVTTDSDGRITVASLDSPNPLTGDSQERFYRALAVLGDSGATRYEKCEFADVPTALATGAGNGLNTGRQYYRSGTYFQLLPKSASAAIWVWVNHIPTKPSGLSGDGVNVTFPEDYELIVAWEAAAMLLMKGATEVGAAAALQQLAEQKRQDMHGDLGREDDIPTFMRAVDSRGAWDG